MQTLDGPEELVNSYRFAGYLVRGQVRHYRLTEFGATAETLGSQQGEHSLRIVSLQLALLPFLDCPCGLADVVHCVAELSQYARLYTAGLDGLLDLDQLRGGFSELEIHAPKPIAGNEKLNSDSSGRGILGTSNSNNPRLGCFARNEVGYLQLATDSGIGFHVQETTVGVCLLGLRTFSDGFAAALLPFCPLQEPQQGMQSHPLPDLRQSNLSGLILSVAWAVEPGAV